MADKMRVTSLNGGSGAGRRRGFPKYNRRRRQLRGCGVARGPRPPRSSVGAPTSRFHNLAAGCRDLEVDDDGIKKVLFSTVLSGGVGHAAGWAAGRNTAGAGQAAPEQR